MSRRKRGVFVFKLNKNKESSLNNNERDAIKELFEVDKESGDSSFLEILDSIATFANVQIKDFSLRQLNTWNFFKAKISTYYGTESYKRLYEIIRARFANIDVSKVEIQTPLAYIFGYRISENDCCSFFYLDNCLLPPSEELSENTLKECNVNFIKMTRNQNNQILQMRTIRPDIPTVIYIVDSNKFEGFTKNVTDALLSSNIDSVTVYQINKISKRFDKIIDNKQVQLLAPADTSRTRNYNNINKESKNFCNTTNIVVGVAILVAIAIIALVVYKRCSLKR